MGNWGGDEKWLDSGYIMKVECTGLVKGLDVEWEKRGGMQDGSKIFYLNSWSCHFLNWR